MKEYVLGFLFNSNYSRVVLISKTKPKWQAGRINGVGGKIEEGETPYQAMVREFKEEAGLEIPSWSDFGVMTAPDWKVHLFAAETKNIESLQSQTEEIIQIMDVKTAATLTDRDAISNISWLVLAAHNFITSKNGPRHLSIDY